MQVKTAPRAPTTLLVDGPDPADHDTLHVLVGDTPEDVTDTPPAGASPGTIQVTYSGGATSLCRGGGPSGGLGSVEGIGPAAQPHHPIQVPGSRGNAGLTRCVGSSGVGMDHRHVAMRPGDPTGTLIS